MGDAPRAPPQVTVVVPTKNEARRLSQTLEALRQQTLPPLEVIVVDAHSGDGTAAVAESHGARVMYEDFGTRAGACQVGIEGARGDLIAFTDADCVPDPRWLEELTSHLGAGIAGVGGRIVNQGASFWERSIDLGLDTILGSANSVQGRPFASPRSVPSISGCNSLYRRQELLDVGGFRTDLLTTEDTELNRRMRRLGLLLYTPGAIVHHRHQRGMRAFAKRMYQYGYGRGQSMLVGPPLLVPLAAALLIPAAWLFPVPTALLLVAYLAAVIVSAVGPARRARGLSYLGSIMLVLFVEHLYYVAGFWVGVWHSRIGRRRRGAVPEVQPH